LDELAIADRTVVFFTSDNGPHSEGGHDPAFFDSNGPFRGIKRDLLEGGIRVPFLARWPGVIAPGSTSEHLAAFEDVLPTLGAIADAQASELPATLDGISFLPALRGDLANQEKLPYRYWAFYERGGGQAIRSGRFKAIEQPIGSPLRIYDLEADPGETTDIAASEPGFAAQAREWMKAAYTPSARWRFPEARSGRSRE
ncbi:MAG TPA: sulfatase-like hydrolase/transferase, partial [Planctomycetota bacterium]|nr:sulfatase-like hydrolase/transferase [Planctomycetota bacterium]